MASCFSLSFIFCVLMCVCVCAQSRYGDRGGSYVASVLATELGKRAFQNSMDKWISTPYSLGATDAFDMVYTGGKKDDITVLTAVITAS
mmetsp:Transcript_6959/g.17091  ORF Transcript_6959/g.17091 Transcript_6959/m.17091 type:complete len:89 (-) Transcript_6959:5-271(-)